MEDMPRIRVVRVKDGDSLIIETRSNPSVEIRLSLIDAPELEQPYGIQATAFLRTLTLGKILWFRALERDRYGRLVGILYDDEEGPSINRQMVAAGWAFYWTRYGTDDSMEAAQEEARARRRGIWGNGDPGLRPWEYREQQRIRTGQQRRSISRPRAGISPRRASQRRRQRARPAQTPAKKPNWIDFLLTSEGCGLIVAAYTVLLFIVLLGIGIFALIQKIF